MKLFVDLDGVLADFDGGYEKAFGKRPDPLRDNVDWEKVHTHPHLFRDLEPMTGALQFWVKIKHLNPIILTGCPRSLPYVGAQKRDWVARYLGPDVPVITCLSREKYTHGSPGDILIDDREKCGLPWAKMGGVWIKHTSIEDTALSLLRHMVLPRSWRIEELARALREQSTWSGPESWEDISVRRKDNWRLFATKVAIRLGLWLVIPH